MNIVYSSKSLFHLRECYGEVKEKEGEFVKEMKGKYGESFDKWMNKEKLTPSEKKELKVIEDKLWDLGEVINMLNKGFQISLTKQEHEELTNIQMS